MLKYFETAGRLASHEWKLAFEAFDNLANAKINWRARQISFADYYKQFIEDIYADQFILSLLEALDISMTAERLQREISRKLLLNLQEEGLYSMDVEASQFLAAYSLYWWNSFARGYRFEIEIYRELDAAGIAYTAHNLLDRAERLSSHDLTILGYLGDIKNTSYFLYIYSRRALPLLSDFYITRLWQARRRRYMIVVILISRMWERINGVTHTASLDDAAHFFPNPIAVMMEEQTWIVIPFHLFQEKVRQKQEEEEEED